MGWEMRHGKLFYYRKERFRDEQGRSRVRSVYCGSGERGEAAACEDEERRVAHSGVTDIRTLKKGGDEFAEVRAKKETAAETQHIQHVNAREEVDTVDTSTRAGEFATAPFAVAARLGYYRGSYGSASDVNRYFVPASPALPLASLLVGWLTPPAVCITDGEQTECAPAEASDERGEVHTFHTSIRAENSTLSTHSRARRNFAQNRPVLNRGCAGRRG